MAVMQAFYEINKAYLEYFPPLLVFLTGIGVAAWSWWSKQKRETTSDNALTYVSGGYKSLSDSQQSRITQLEKMATELQNENNRLRDLIETMRAAKTIRGLIDSEGGG